MSDELRMMLAGLLLRLDETAEAARFAATSEPALRPVYSMARGLAVLVRNLPGEWPPPRIQ